MLLTKSCTQYVSTFGKLSSGHRTGKGQFPSQSQRKTMPKNAQTTAIALISRASKVMLKILQAGLQQYVKKMNFQMFKLNLEKAEAPEIKLPTSVGLSKTQENSRKTSTSALWLCQSLWLCGRQQTLENSERDGNTRPPDLPPEKSICRSRSNS